jgi:hypothetical protein
MLHIQKEITSGHGVTCNCWQVTDVSFKDNEDGTFTANGNLRLFVNHQAMIDKKVLIDNAQWSFNDLTLAEINSNTLAVIYSKLLTSKVSTSHSGEVDITGGTIIQ